MDEIIKSLYLRLDANTSTLTRSAIGQILVKIIYSFNGLVSKDEIFKTYAQLNNISKTNEKELLEILEELVDKDIKKKMVNTICQRIRRIKYKNPCNKQKKEKMK